MYLCNFFGMRNNHFLLQQKKAETNARKRMQDFGRHAQGIENLIKPLGKMHQAEVRGSKQFGLSVPSALKRRSGFGAQKQGKEGRKKRRSNSWLRSAQKQGKEGRKKLCRSRQRGRRKFMQRTSGRISFLHSVGIASAAKSHQIFRNRCQNAIKARST